MYTISGSVLVENFKLQSKILTWYLVVVADKGKYILCNKHLDLWFLFQYFAQFDKTKELKK